MKKLTLLIAAGLMIALPACKKGENDPFLSLSSRKGRLAGEYKLDSWENSVSTVNSDGDKQEIVTTLTGSTGQMVIKDTPSGEATTTKNRTITVQKGEMNFEKDGTWSSTLNITTTWTEESDDFLVDSYTYVVVTTSQQSGIWSFLGGQSDEFKKKERVMLDILDVTSTEQTDQTTNYEDGSTFTNNGNTNTTITTNPNGDETIVFEIDMLKGKEMVFVQDLSGVDITKTTSGALTFTSTFTTTGNTTIEMSEK